MSANFGRRSFIKVVGGIGGLAMASGSALNAARAPRRQGESVEGLRTSPMEEVRVGIIGCGSRSGVHIRHMAAIEGARITAVCDNYEPAAKNAAERYVNNGGEAPAIYADGDRDYIRMLDDGVVDIVYILTPWEWHAEMCIESMERGAHAFVELPAATTLEDCWKIVDTAEKTQKHCMLLENVCYGRDELMVLNMCRQGAFGTLTHGEGAYIHDLRYQLHHIERGTGSWRKRHHETTNGSLYPMHGLGPIAQYMNVDRGDRFTLLTSMSSLSAGFKEYCAREFPADHPRNQATYICGDMNSCLIKTYKGRSILVQHDVSTHRPYSRLNLIQGTQGIFSGFPSQVSLEKWGNKRWQDMDKCRKEYEHPLWSRMQADAAKHGGHGGMDFIMNWRVIDCLLNGLPLDINVYETASWSAVVELSVKSVANDSVGLEFPDFTRGGWRTAKPLGIIE